MRYGDKDIAALMPELRGRLRADAELSEVNWFRVGGRADVLFKPEDVQDLAYFLSRKPADLPVTLLGVGSNILIRDGGLEGVVIRLGRAFATATAEGDILHAGAGGLGLNAAITAQQAGIGGLEFLSGIPGSVGGALFMNAGAYGRETADILLHADVVDDKGNLHRMDKPALGFSYRHSALPDGWVFVGAAFCGVMEDKKLIQERMDHIAQERGASQPVRARTGGSTFKNPAGAKAWELIDKAGCRGLTIGGAQVSEKHCNFLINTGSATADELERLGEEVRRRVFETTGIMLEWEIKRIGRAVSEHKEQMKAAV